MAQPGTESYIKCFGEIGIKDVPLVGGKTASLGEMFQELAPRGVKVPDGFAITAQAYRDFLHEALSVEKTTPPKNRGYGVHLTLQTNKETISVHLGPAWYLEKQTPQIEANDTVRVTGSRVTVDGKPAIIAAQVKKGNDILKLRGDNGVSAWSGAGRRNQ
jgi:phosphoenolpyruvate synthase/pyruvate phosphate dikinase